MSKRELKPHMALHPIPAVLVTSVTSEGRPNVMTISWIGPVCSVPPMLTIGVRPQRFSHDLIQESKEFVVNMPRADMVWVVDYCGTRSGKKEDKIAICGLTLLPASRVKPPLIAECPLNLECVVRHELKLGTHDLFVAEIVALHGDEEVVGESGKIDVSKVNALVYATPEYWSLGAKLAIGTYSLRTGRPVS